MDLKVMPRLQRGYWYILCMIVEMTNYLITTPLYQARWEEVGEALIENVISKFGTPDLHNDGSGQCINVILEELLIQEVGIYCQDSRPLQQQVITGRAWYKIFVKHTV